ncbi:unnamed protein product [Closterium sp. Yama58-4]|nr:unnamed protein product [Closterium sp. Yama58-4]
MASRTGLCRRRCDQPRHQILTSPLFLILPLALLAASALPQARAVTRKDFARAVNKVATYAGILFFSPGYKLEQLLMEARGIKGPVTALLPVRGYFAYTRSHRMGKAQLRKVRRYHFLNGTYSYEDLQGLMRYSKVTTINGLTITKTNSNKWPLVWLQGAAGPPAVIIEKNYYRGLSLTVHLISRVLKPKLR